MPIIKKCFNKSKQNQYTLLWLSAAGISILNHRLNLTAQNIMINYTNKGITLSVLGLKIALSYDRLGRLHKTPLISVIVPVYNTSAYLSECLQSIVSQTFQNIEIICVNDGSTDDSLQILQNFAANDKRIKIISQPNRGLSAARNAGLRLAKGRYVMFVDSDDSLLPHALVTAFKAAAGNRSDITVFGYLPRWVPQKLSERYAMPENRTFSCKDITDRIFGYWSVWSKIYSNAFIRRNKLSFPEGLVFEDVWFHSCSMLLAKKISLINDRLYNYRTDNAASIMHTASKSSKAFDIISVFVMTGDFILQHPDSDTLLPPFCRAVLNELGGHIQNAAPQIADALYQKFLAWEKAEPRLHQALMVCPEYEPFKDRFRQQ